MSGFGGKADAPGQASLGPGIAAFWKFKDTTEQSVSLLRRFLFRWAVAEDHPPCHEALVSRQVVGHVEPGNALWVKGVRSWPENIRIIESADVDCADWPLIAKDSFPSERCSAVGAKRPVDARR